MGGGGGAWKVAYADFVTTMMALFMVLWISVQDHKILIATSRYFQSPFHSQVMDHSGVMPFNKQSDSRSSKDEDQSAAAAKADEERPIDVSFLNAAAADFYRLLHVDQDLEKKPINVEVTTDGLRVTLFDRTSQPLFKGNTAEFTEWGKFLMQNLSWLIDRHHFHVMIDGHTSSGLKMTDPNYSSWELSADRANAARRTFVFYAVDPGMIERVTGYADTQPLPGEKPESASNERITLSLSLTPKVHSAKAPARGGPRAIESTEVRLSPAADAPLIKQ